MIKRIIVAVALLLASFQFAFIGMWIAPYAVGVLHSAITYNIVLGVILGVLAIITIVLLCKKHLRIYSLLFIPHIIALGIVMLHVGNNIYYMGSGFIRVGFKPYPSILRIQTTSGRVIFKDAHSIHLFDAYGKVFFYEGIGYTTFWSIYDVNGNCILEKPKDDERMGCFDEGFWSEKVFKRNNDQIYRIRFFDLSGNYIFTRFYKSAPFFSIIKSIDEEDFIKEATEDVTELSDGKKMFSEAANKSNISEYSQQNNDRLANVGRTTSSNSAQVSEQKECSRCHGVGRHKKIVCPTCHGVGEITDWDYRDPNSFAPPPTTTCKQCNGRRLIDCPLSLNDSHYSNPFRNSPQNVDYNRYSQYNYEVAPVQIDRTKDPCGACHGTGKCTSCGGLGMTYNNMTEKYYKCDVCHQSGVCVGCNGRRYL